MQPAATVTRVKAAVTKFVQSLSLLQSIPLLVHPQLCPDIVFAATPPYDGTLGRYYRVPADLAYPLPDNVTLEDGAMVRISIFVYISIA